MKTETIEQGTLFGSDFDLSSQENQSNRPDDSDLQDSERFRQFVRSLKACRRCRDSFGFEPAPIQWGEQDARILVISQAPGERVHRLGRPFADLSGKKLRQQWFLVSEEQFYNPHLFYFSMAGHCFPGKNARGTDRKPPKCCWTLWGERELRLLKTCRLILVIGKEAANRIFPGRTLDELVFSDLELNGKPCFVLPHPSPLNYRWPKAHPQFEQDVLPRVQKAVYRALDLGQDQRERLLRADPSEESWQRDEKKPRNR